MLGPTCAQRLESGPAIVQRHSDAKEVGELAVEVEHAALWVVNGTDDDIAHATQAGGEHAERDGFSGAGIARDEREATIGEREFNASAEGIYGWSSKQGFLWNFWAKWVEFQAIDGLQRLAGHQNKSFSSKPISSVGAVAVGVGSRTSGT